MIGKDSRTGTTTKTCLALLFLLAIAPALAWAAPGDADVLRIGLLKHFEGVKQISVHASSDYTITTTSTADRLATTPGAVSISLEVGQDGITLKRDTGATANVGDSVTIAPSDASALIMVNSPNRRSKRYHGFIEVNLRSGALQLVNVVNPQDYLSGVLPAEMGEAYPEEALKAQAIAARTYALKNRRKHAAHGFELCDRGDCQVYEGAVCEGGRCALAVKSTRDQVLTYNGDLASIMYSADCGGATQDYKDVSPKSNIPYLCGVAEPCGVTHLCWEKTYRLSDVEKKFLAAGVKQAAGLKSVKVTKISSLGRALSVEVSGANATTSLPAARFKAIIDNSGIKSTMFKLACSAEGALTVKGTGLGHGVGLCQVGAKGLAQAPNNYTYDRILAHYFPGTAISPISPSSEPQQTAMKPTQMASAAVDAPPSRPADPKPAQAAPVPVPKQDAPQPAPKPVAQQKKSDGIGFQVRVEAPGL